MPAGMFDRYAPERGSAGSQNECSQDPPMGLRLRLRADDPVQNLPRQARIIAIAMQRYGIIVADNGTEWFVQGASNSHFRDDALHHLNEIAKSDFVVVDTSTLRNG